MGCSAGVVVKLLAGTITWVLVVYLIDLVFLGFDWGACFRNRRLDARRAPARSREV